MINVVRRMVELYAQVQDLSARGLRWIIWGCIVLALGQCSELLRKQTRRGNCECRESLSVDVQYLHS